MKALRILIADDHEVVRRGLRAILETQPGWAVVAEAATGRQAVEQAIRLQPDIVIMDISMPELNGLEATRQILKAVPRTQVLALSVHDSEELVREVLLSGARGYLLKTDAGRDLVAAVDALRQRHPFFTTRVSELVLEGYLKSAAGSQPEQRFAPLSTREVEITQLLAEGKTNKEVAAVLHISVKTVETHRSHIMEKLHLRSLSDLVRYAIRNRIIQS